MRCFKLSRAPAGFRDHGYARIGLFPDIEEQLVLFDGLIPPVRFLVGPPQKVVNLHGKGRIRDHVLIVSGECPFQDESRRARRPATGVRRGDGVVALPVLWQRMQQMGVFQQPGIPLGIEPLR